MRVVICKSARELTLWNECALEYRCRVALGCEPVGCKLREGDGRTPEGDYYICIIKEAGKYGRSLGLSYPNERDARRGLEAGIIDASAYEAVLSALERRVRPPWGTALGGEIYLHEGGTASDWTQGCIALEPQDMARLYSHREDIELVRILP